ncbi:FCD domain-containing protein [Cribrihabitans marinus]|uniref:FCD domain-containing protein n=1 Tax=Cribrihabitans marinus TaxID=1227549 RepID=A0A1H7DV03_9RHOB|nr:FCD domain-containing protein [Cribrihabitans marinus]SEK03512.1 FCD domain-containing protein [Cribrihabitans marinus]
MEKANVVARACAELRDKLRCALECEAVRRLIERDDRKQIEALVDHLDRTEPIYVTCEDFSELARMDEAFDIKIAKCSGNAELVDMLRNVNERMRYFRTINRRQLRLQPQSDDPEGLSAHWKIVRAIVAKDTETAVAATSSAAANRSSNS